MDGPALGLSLAKTEAEAYRQLPCSSQGKLRLKAVCDNSPCFARIPTHQTQVGQAAASTPWHWTAVVTSRMHAVAAHWVLQRGR